jgi:hypothetical protein
MRGDLYLATHAFLLTRDRAGGEFFPDVEFQALFK